MNAPALGIARKPKANNEADTTEKRKALRGVRLDQSMSQGNGNHFQ